MKKPDIQIILILVVAFAVIFAGINCVGAMRTQKEVQESAEKDSLAVVEMKEQVETQIQEAEEKEEEERQKAIEEKRRKEAEAAREKSGEEDDSAEDSEDETEEDVEEDAEEGVDWSNTQNSTTQTASTGGKIVGIDPGHQSFDVDMSATEPNGPGSSEMKVRCTTGTAGNYTGLGEYELNLDVSLKLRDILEERGYTVVMTRETNDANISNRERAQLVTEAGADIYVRIHANSDNDTSLSGALTMCQSPSNPYVGNLYEESYRLSETIINSYCEATGMGNRGVMTSDTMTGINWSTMPVTIVEMGFMSNQNDDTLMADSAYQDKMAEGIANGIDAYFAAVQ